MKNNKKNLLLNFKRPKGLSFFATFFILLATLAILYFLITFSLYALGINLPEFMNGSIEPIISSLNKTEVFSGNPFLSGSLYKIGEYGKYITALILSIVSLISLLYLLVVIKYIFTGNNRKAVKIYGYLYGIIIGGLLLTILKDEREEKIKEVKKIAKNNEKNENSLERKRYKPKSWAFVFSMCISFLTLVVLFVFILVTLDSFNVNLGVLNNYFNSSNSEYQMKFSEFLFSNIFSNSSISFISSTQLFQFVNISILVLSFAYFILIVNYMYTGKYKKTCATFGLVYGLIVFSLPLFFYKTEYEKNGYDNLESGNYGGAPIKQSNSLDDEKIEKLSKLQEEINRLNSNS